MSSKDKPAYRAKIVRNYTDKEGVERSHLTDIGGVWPRKDGKGFDVTLNALPVDGRLSIRLDEPKAAKEPAAAEA